VSRSKGKLKDKKRIRMVKGVQWRGRKGRGRAEIKHHNLLEGPVIDWESL